MSNHKNVPYRIYPPENCIPKQWYNLRADMKELPDPMLNPGTLEPLKEEELYPVFCEALRTRRWTIPRATSTFLRVSSTSIKCTALPAHPCVLPGGRARTPAKIYYKFEGNNTSATIAQFRDTAGLFREKQGITQLTTETGRASGAPLWRWPAPTTICP